MLQRQASGKLQTEKHIKEKKARCRNTVSVCSSMQHLRKALTINAGCFQHVIGVQHEICAWYRPEQVSEHA